MADLAALQETILAEKLIGVNIHHHDTGWVVWTRRSSENRGWAKSGPQPSLEEAVKAAFGDLEPVVDDDDDWKDLI